MIRTSVARAVLVIASIWSFVDALNSNQPTTQQSLLLRVKAAIALAYDACDLWSALPIHKFPVDSVRATISLVLHATCLLRVRQDAEAVQVYGQRDIWLVTQTNGTGTARTLGNEFQLFSILRHVGIIECVARDIDQCLRMEGLE